MVWLYASTDPGYADLGHADQGRRGAGSLLEIAALPVLERFAALPVLLVFYSSSVSLGGVMK